jgi:DNA repair photolyase
MQIKEIQASTAISASGLPGLDFALNPYRGCQHACAYCYSPDVLREARWREWGDFVDVKQNLPIILSKQKNKLSGTVGLGTVTDPYQQAEEKYKITRYCLEQLARSDCTVSIQTKSDMVLRDLDILKKMKNVEVGFTITTLDERLAGRLEPGAPSPARRLEALRKLSGSGIKTWVFLGPVIPTMNDSEGSLAEVLASVKGAGCTRILFDKLRLKPLVRNRLAPVLGNETEKIFAQAGQKAWADAIYFKIKTLCRGAGLKCERAF